MLLARQGVDHLLVSARPGTSDLPKAHVLNQRAMEILEDCGVADAIAERSTPADQMAATAYYAGFAGPEPDYGRRLARLEAWGAGGENDNWRAASPWRQLNLPQIRLEPILKAGAETALAGPDPLQPRAARARAGRRRRARASCATTAPARSTSSAAEYLLGADGGRRCASQIGVELRGPRRRDADRDAARERRLLAVGARSDVLIRWIVSPQAGALVVMVPMGPERWGPDSEEWVIHLNYPADDPRAQSDEQVEADVRAAIGLARRPDDDPQDHALVRRRGDGVGVPRRTRLPARRRRAPPPADGGLGLTSAIHDVQNLCWKLAAVLAGQASPDAARHL